MDAVACTSEHPRPCRECDPPAAPAVLESRRERDPHQLGHAAGTGLRHEIGAVDLDCARRDAEVVGDDLVDLSRQQPLQQTTLYSDSLSRAIRRQMAVLEPDLVIYDTFRVSQFIDDPRTLD